MPYNLAFLGSLKKSEQTGQVEDKKKRKCKKPSIKCLKVTYLRNSEGGPVVDPSTVHQNPVVI